MMDGRIQDSRRPGGPGAPRAGRGCRPGRSNGGTRASRPRCRTRVSSTRDDAVLCGRPWFEEVFRQLDPGIAITWHVAEGASVVAGTVLCERPGPGTPCADRRAHGAQFPADAVGNRDRGEALCRRGGGHERREFSTRARPFRGCARRRNTRSGSAAPIITGSGLFDAILVKENHIVAAGSIGSAIRRSATPAARACCWRSKSRPSSRWPRPWPTVRTGCCSTTFPSDRLRDAVRLRHDRWRRPRNSRRPVASRWPMSGQSPQTGVDFISIGDITKNIHAVDLSMRFRVSAR